MRTILLLSMMISLNTYAGEIVRRDPVETYHYMYGEETMVRANLYNNGYWGIGVPGAAVIFPTGDYYYTRCTKVKICEPSGYCWAQQHCN